MASTPSGVHRRVGADHGFVQALLGEIQRDQGGGEAVGQPEHHGGGDDRAARDQAGGGHQRPAGAQPRRQA